MCEACGQVDEQCCPGDTCDTNALCMSGMCEACGQVDEQCCPGDTCPNSQAVCVEGFCEALTDAPVMAWGTMLTLVGVLTGVGSLGLAIRSGANEDNAAPSS
jgi:hypothetical protein